MRRRLATYLVGLALLAAVVPAAGAAEEGGKPEWGYEHGLFFKTDRFELKIGGRLQFRSTFTDPDSGDSIGSFRIRRARFFGSGFAYQPWIKYKFQFDAVGAGNVTGVTPTTTTIDTDGDTIPDTEVVTGLKSSKSQGFDLLDFHFDFARAPLATVRVGQYKAPFGQQQLTSSGSQQFVDRSIASEAFAPGRDQGIDLFGTTKSKRFGYDVGVFNGNGRNKDVNDNDNYLYVARIHFDPNGEYKLEESATTNPDQVLWTVGAAWMQNARDPAGDLDQTALEGFLSLMYKRLSILGDFYDRSADLSGGGSLDSDGYVAQVGYFFVPSHFEIALRSSLVDPDKDVSDDKEKEAGVAFNYFIEKHRFKVQADFRKLTRETTAGDVETNEARAQLQVIF